MQRVCLAAGLLCVWTSAQGISPPPYLAELQQRAVEEGLSDHREWQDLLHYRQRRFLPGRRSATRDRGFFNAENGWHDPEAELTATLAAFFTDPAELSGDEQHPQCRFIARRHWLTERLDIDLDQLPDVECTRFQEWYDAIDPHRATLIFAAAYLGNPASMFGHTLLRVDPERRDEDTRLLSYAINHAAATEESSGLVFAVRGLTGGYPGRFSILPYYEKVREYSSLESRDLWEYQLALDPEEVQRMLRHTWELREIGFPYYFLYQNCSYRLLALLDVARPGLELSDRFDWYAIPTDTLRAVLAEAGMLDDVVFRPAERTRLDHQLAGLSNEEIDWVVELAERSADPNDARGATPASRARVLESAYGYLHFRYQAGQTDGDERERMRQLLVARSTLGREMADDPLPEPETRPDEGHGTLRLGLGAGQRDRADMASVHWRPAYHDLLDPPAGYIPGAHIAYGDLEIRYDLDRSRLLLERLMLVDIESLNPRDRLFQPWSWRIRGGAEQRIRPGKHRSLMAGVDGGGGGTWTLGETPAWLYAGLQGGAWGSERLDDGVRAGAGPQLDLIWGGERLRSRVRAGALWNTDVGSAAWELGLEQSLIVSDALSLRVAVKREQDFGYREDSVHVTVFGYF